MDGIKYLMTIPLMYRCHLSTKAYLHLGHTIYRISQSASYDHECAQVNESKVLVALI
jgi:hypothetical protein